jgi:O-antigen/teichoic acid export membrane protein
MTPTSRFARGTFWASTDNWTAQLAQLVTFLWAGNIVGPSVVGVMSIAMIVMTFAYQLLVDSLSEPLVQRVEIDARHVATAFWSVFLLGVATLLATQALAGPIAWLFSEPVLEPALRVLALCFPFMGPTSALQALLQREFRFRALALRSLVVFAVASPACIALAYAGFGVWSLVLYQLLIRVMDFLVLSTAVRWLPRPQLSRRHFADLWSYGRHNLKFRLVDFISLNLERVVIGYFLGPAALGLFSLARRIVDSVHWALGGVMNSVALALFSRAQEDRAALAALFRRTTLIAGVIMIPAFAGLAAIAPFLIEALLRPEWLPMVPLVQILCLYGLVQADVYFSATVLRALGRIDLVYRVGLFVVAAKLVGFLVAVRFGSLAIAWTMVVVHAAAAPTLFGIVCARVPDAGAGRLRAYGLPALAAAVMALAVLGAGRELAALPAPTRLALVTAGGFLVYWLALGILQPRAALTSMAWLAQRLSLRRM